MLSVSQETSPDLFNAIFQRDWAAVGGWSLFIGVTVWLLIYIPRAFANEKIVPGAQHRRQVEANVKLSAAVDALTQQNGQLITANEITKHFFQETTPKRGEATEWDTSPVERRQSMGQTPTL
jgi:hypothetical protein